MPFWLACTHPQLCIRAWLVLFSISPADSECRFMNKRTLTFLFFAISLLVGLFLLFSPVPVQQDAALLEETAPSAGSPLEIELTIADGAAQEPAVHRIRQGQEVVLKVLLPRNDKLHLHGYDIHQHVKANEPAAMRFTAIHTGRFELELHKSHALLAVLEVHPD